jgi:hypothetical protein
MRGVRETRVVKEEVGGRSCWVEIDDDNDKEEDGVVDDDGGGASGGALRVV